jgi:hypothetical protein
MGGGEAAPMFDGATKSGIEGEREKKKGQDKRKEGPTNLGGSCHIRPNHVYSSVRPRH